MRARLLPALLLGVTAVLSAAENQTDSRFAEVDPALSSPASAQPARAGADARDPVADKFRKLQHEMSNGDAGLQPGRTAARGDAPETGDSVNVLAVSAKILIGLFFVILLAIVAIRLLKRFQGRMLAKGGRGAGGEIFEVLETCHLGQHQRVVALRMHGEVGIVGVTQQGITLLTMLKEPADEVRRAEGQGNPAAFSENLNKLLDRFKRPKRVSDLLDEA